MLRVLGLLTAMLVMCACGYIGEPLPPALNIPQRVTNLTVVQTGVRIVATFSLPRLTTDGLTVKRIGRMELSLGPSENPFRADAWAARAQPAGQVIEEGDGAHAEVPAAGWVGQQITAAVKIFSVKGRDAGWSNFVTLAIVPPLATPSAVQAEAVPTGVRVAWQATAGRFQIFRRIGEEKRSLPVGESDSPSYIDTTSAYGTSYHYSVEAINRSEKASAASEMSQEAGVVPKDVFPPSVPAGVTAIVSTASVELTWERSLEPDLAGYRVYRAKGESPFELLGESQTAPTYSDRTIRPGTRYRYAISSIDNIGNESARSAPVEVTSP
jgi:hypothetical protein